MTGSREHLLSAVREAVSEGTSAEAGGIPRTYRRRGALERGALLGRFEERVRDYRAKVIQVGSQGLAQVVAESLGIRRAERLVVPGDLPDAWLASLPPSTELRRDRTHAPLSPAEVAACDGVLTGCAAGIAETGTLILDGGAAQGRRAITLLPDYHLCVIFGSQVVETVPEALDVLAGAVHTRGAPLTFISGPSATSDIELIRVEGVHGPRTLEVLLVEDA